MLPQPRVIYLCIYFTAAEILIDLLLVLSITGLVSLGYFLLKLHPSTCY